jgi:hypothetical protein
MVQKYRKQTDKFVLLTVNFVPDQDYAAPALLQRANCTFTALRVPDRQWAFQNYGVLAGPTNFLLDQGGRIVYSPYVHSNSDRETVESVIDALLARSAAQPPRGGVEKR